MLLVDTVIGLALQSHVVVAVQSPSAFTLAAVATYCVCCVQVAEVNPLIVITDHS
jgi:hypothetical protein